MDEYGFKTVGYGRFGRPTYDAESNTWTFGRQHNQNKKLQVLGVLESIAGFTRLIVSVSPS